MTAHGPISQAIAGPVLILEDEALISAAFEELVRELGASEVHIHHDVDEARGIATTAPLAYAILDIHVGNRSSVEVADALAERQIPFLFSSAAGVEDLHDRHRGRPLLDKPFSDEDLRASILRILGLSPAGQLPATV